MLAQAQEQPVLLLERLVAQELVLLLAQQALQALLELPALLELLVLQVLVQALVQALDRLRERAPVALVGDRIGFGSAGTEGGIQTACRPALGGESEVAETVRGTLPPERPEQGLFRVGLAQDLQAAKRWSEADAEFARAREQLVAHGMKLRRTIGSPGYPTPEPDLRAFVVRALQRSAYPPGFIRQLMAVLASGSRVDLLKTIHVPTLVLHGEDDPLVPVEGGRDTARQVPGAKLTTIPGWGHDLPAELVLRLVDAVATHCKAA